MGVMGVIIMLLIFAIALYIPVRYRYPKESKAHIHKIQKEIEKERIEETEQLKKSTVSSVSNTSDRKTTATAKQKTSTTASKSASSKQQRPLTGSGKDIGIHFGGWPEEVHSSPDQIGRMNRGLEINTWNIKLDSQNQTAFIKSDSTRNKTEKWYHVTLSSCDCPDFYNNTKRKAPCKHIYALANALGLLGTEPCPTASEVTPPDDSKQAQNFLQDAQPAIDAWPPECHTRPEQIKRMKIGRTLKDHIVYFDPRRKEACMSDSWGEILNVTLFYCECEYFSNYHLPCEHIYCLADSLGLLPPEVQNNPKKSATKTSKQSTKKTAGSATNSQKKSSASDNKFSSQKNAEPVVSSNIRFGQWPTKTHLQPGQEERMKRGHKIKDQFLTIDPQRQAAYMANPNGAPYRVTLSSCDCEDFSLRHLPCEHIYCLADSFGLLPTKQAKRSNNTSSAYSNIKFGHWPRRCHSTDDQIARIKKGKKLKNTIITLDWNSQVACMKGDSNMDYYVTLNSCNCTDFYRRHLPCEHIYCLADTLGLLEPVSPQKKNAGR